MFRRLTALGIAALGAVVGVYTLDVARSHTAESVAGTSLLRDAALLAVGWAAIGCGLVDWWRRPRILFGPLLTVAGFAWFLLEWNNSGVGSSAVFTIGLVFYATAPPFFAHAVLTHRSHPSRVETIALASAYAGGVLVLGLLPALFFDPAREGCGACPSNLALVSSNGELAADLTQIGLYAAIGWALVLAALIALRAARAGAERLGTSVVFLGGGLYVALVAGMFAAAANEGILSNGVRVQRFWLGQAAMVLVVAAAVTWNWLRVRHARTAVARLVVELGSAPAVGDLRDVLSEILGDSDLELAYPLGESGSPVDARGNRVAFARNREQTTLMREGRVVAIVGHEPGLLADDQLVDELTSAARLALENERLQAEVYVRLEELRRSRARIVEAADAERKRLERDLHDGAQQRLVALSLSLRLLRSQLAVDDGGKVVALLTEAEQELQSGIAELRDLAHGLFPAVLADEGFAAAVSALAEEARVPIRVRMLPEERSTAATETAAYTVVSEAARNATGTVTVSAAFSAHTLVVQVYTNDGEFDLVELDDRIGAVDGSLGIERADGMITIRAEIPCAS